MHESMTAAYIFSPVFCQEFEVNKVQIQFNLYNKNICIVQEQQLRELMSNVLLTNIL